MTLQQTAKQMITHLTQHPEDAVSVILATNPGMSVAEAWKEAYLFIGLFEPGLSRKEQGQRFGEYKQMIRQDKKGRP